MGDILSWSAIISLATASDKILDKNKRKELMKKFKLLISSNRKIVVFGISGTGKTQFINNLKNNLILAERTLSSEKIRFDIDDIPIEFIDTPGHQIKGPMRIQELKKILKNGAEGIINVISYGYEENPDEKLNDIFTAEEKVKESFLKLNRKAEISRLREWLPLIEPKDSKWIINLVNKADLWYDDINEVQKYYESGDFNKKFEHHSQFMNVVTLPYCSIIKPYYNTKTSGRFGEIEKANLHNYFMNQFFNMLKLK